jgi:hypothetical protein
MTLTKDKADALRKPFPDEVVGQLPKPYAQNSPKGTCKDCGGWHGLPAAHLDYVGHAAVTDRLLLVDPEWNWEPFSVDERGLPALDSKGNLWIRLTICGVTRVGVGDGKNAKECIGDAIRNAAMRFGVALDLWSKDELEQGTPKTRRRKAEQSPDEDAGPTRRMSRSSATTPRQKEEAKMFGLLSQTGRKDKAAILAFVSKVCARDVTSSADLTDKEIGLVVAELQVEVGA